MKRITFLTLFSALLMIPFAYGQSFTSLEVSSTKTNSDPITSATVIDRGDLMKSTTVIITNNFGQTSSGSDLACANPTSIQDNIIWSEYDLGANFGITADFEVTSVEFGMGAVLPGSSVPITINVYSNDGVFPAGTWTLQGTAPYTVTDTDDNTIVSVPLSATIPAGDKLLFEISNPNMEPTPNQYRYMTNGDGALAESWIQAPVCGIATPTTMTGIGFGGLNFIMNVLGDEVVVPPVGYDHYYVISSVGGHPWGDSNNTMAMDLTFGTGNWVQEYFESLDPVAVFGPDTNFVYLEGSDSGADELNTFLGANLPAIEAWVNAGGKLLLNAAPNEGGNINFGFSGSTLNYNYPSTASSNVTVADTSHPAFLGPNTPTAAVMTGNSYSHANVSGTGFTDLVIDTGNPSMKVAVEKAWGSGKVIMGGMTTVNWHSPAPEAYNYRANLLHYLGVGNAPIISCPVDVVADSDPGVCGAVVNFADASAIDLEDGAVATTQTMGPASGSVFPIGVTTIEFSATDSDGNTVTCQFTVTLTDIEDPVAMCQDITVELDASGMATITPADIDAGSTDNCSIASYGIVDTNTTPLTECGNAPEPIPNTGTSGPMNPSVATVADSGIIGTDFSVANVTLNVEHSWASDLDMTLTSPAGTVLELSTDNGGSTGLDTAADLVFTDASGNDITAWSGGAPAADYLAEGGLFSTTFAGEDINGNWTLDITDDTGGDSGMLNSFCITFTPSGVVSLLTLTCDNVGPNDVTLVVTDPSGNTDTCIAVVTVEDNQAPVVVCMGEDSAPCDQSNPSNAFENGRGCNSSNGWTAANDLIVDADVDFALNQVSANIFLEVGSTITSVDVFYYDDNAGVPGTVIGSQAGVVPTSQDIIGDNFGFDIAQVILDVTPFDFASQSGIPTTYWVGISTFNNATAELRNFWEVSTASAVGNALAFNDGSGYIISAPAEDGVYTFSGMCEVPPTPPLEVVLDADGMVTVDAMDLIFSVDDNCNTVATFGSGGGVSGSLTSLFAAGNNGSPGGAVYFDITVGPSDINVTSIDINTADAGAFTMDVYALMGTYVGNEGNAGAWGTPTNAAGTAAGLDLPSNAVLDTPMTLSAGDTYGIALVLDATHAHHYTNGDGSNENFSNADMSMQLGAASNVPFDGSPFAPRVFNGTINYSAGGGTTMDLDCSNLGENTLDVTVTDGAGNEATCTATVIVLDETAPVLVCGPEPELMGSASDSPGMAIPDADPVGVTTTIEVTDDFVITDLNVDVNITHTWRGDLDITITSPAGTVVVLKAADISDSAADVIVTYDDEGTAGVEALSAFDGESTMGTWTLFVADQFGGDTGTINSWGVIYTYDNPSSDLIIELGPDGTVTIEPIDVLSTLEEACEVDVMLLDITEFSCDDIGAPILVTVFANDTSGNFASCQVEVNIVDLMAPTLTCHGNTTAPFDPATGLYELPDYIATGDTFATDNCTEESMIILTQTPAPGTQLPATGGTPHIISFTAEDEYGNISTCEFELEVAVVGVQENEILANALALYPNPATNLVTLENSSQISLETALIYDLNGKLIAEFDLQEMQRETTLDISNFSSGVFMVKIIGENASTVKRLIKE